jgi:hypothetical protein
VEAINAELQAEIQEFVVHAARHARSNADLIDGIRQYAERLIGEPVTVSLGDDGKLSINVPVTHRAPASP